MQTSNILYAIIGYSFLYMTKLYLAHGPDRKANLCELLVVQHVAVYIYIYIYTYKLVLSYIL